MSDLDLANQRVLIREDLNVPMQAGRITDTTRIERALPTIQQAQQANARVIVMSHLGRPTEGSFEAQYSLKPVAKALSEALGQPVRLVNDWFDLDLNPGEVVMLENVRFNQGENENDAALAQDMAHQCDIFVMDAFATAHRAQASTVGVARFAPIACAGPLLTEELQALSAVLDQPKQPLVAIVGGSKVSSKIQLLEALLDKVDTLIVGGGIANTLLAAQGVNVGKSLYESDWVASAEKFLANAKTKGVNVPLPVDVVVASEFSADASATTKKITELTTDDMILDVGPETAATYPALMQAAGTIVWNGPVGVFEFANFSAGTRALGEAVAASPGVSIAGGGDTLAALAQFHLTDKMSYVSTGGGAFLEYLEGKTLPAVAILEKRHEHVA